MDLLMVAIPTLVALLIGLAAGYWMRKSIAESKISSAEEAARQIVEQAKKEAEAKQKEIVLEAKDEAFRLRSEAEAEIRERRNEVTNLEKRNLQREEALERKMALLEKRNSSCNR
jgi:ribonuclease Y